MEAALMDAGSLHDVALNTWEPGWGERKRVLVRDGGDINYANFVDRVTGLYRQRSAFVLDRELDLPGFKGHVLSFDDVRALVDRMAHALRALGVQPGDRVGLVTLNRIEMAFCNFAAAKIGAIPVPMNFMLRANEIEHVVQKAGIELLVCDPGVFEMSIKDISAVPSVKRWAMIDETVREGMSSIPRLMAEATGPVEPVEPASPDDTAVLFFTSGTTGFPKGADLSHRNVMIYVNTHVRWAARLQPKMSRHLNLAMLVMPVAAAAGYQQLLLNMGFGTPVYFSSRFDTAEIFDVVERLKPSVFSGSPAMYRMLLAAGAAEHDWSSIRTFGGGADAFDDDLVRNVRALAVRRTKLGMKRRALFIRGYGMAEANSYVAMSPPFEAGDNCCGWVLPPVKYRIVDEDERDVPRGQPGELLLKGPNITKGYWNDPEATAAVFTTDGWYRTGDMMRVGKWRMLFFVGRSADIIKSGGYKISANEIDQHLTQHPDVEHASAVGIPHPIKGERPFAAVKLRPGGSATADEILEWARARIAPYKCPRAIVVMEDMPFTMSMKPKRREVRARLMDALPETVRAGTE